MVIDEDEDPISLPNKNGVEDEEEKKKVDDLRKQLIDENS